MPTNDFGLSEFLNLEVKNKSGSLQWFEWEQKSSPDLGRNRRIGVSLTDIPESDKAVEPIGQKISHPI
jgi:hypothetical protein